MKQSSHLIIGVLAVQGAFFEHLAMLERLKVEGREVRRKEDLEGVSGLIIPGGESTTISKLMKSSGLKDELQKLARKRIPLFGTCAGAVLMAKQVAAKIVPETLKLMDIEVSRNAYGGQLDSFEEDVDLPVLKKTFHGIFIRAPKIEKVGRDVDVLAQLQSGEIVMAREENLLVSAFHPELTSDTAVHEYFLEICLTSVRRHDGFFL